MQWFVMRAYKREADAESYLQSHGFATFVARRWELRTYHGRRQRKLVPAIPGVIFVRGDRDELQQAKQSGESAQGRAGKPLNLQWLMHPANDNSPMTVPEAEMESFIAVARSMETDIRYYSPGEIALDRGERVRIIGGQFDGIEGTLLHPLGRRSQRVYLTIDGLATIATNPHSPLLLQPL